MTRVALDSLLDHIHSYCTPDEIAYLVRHLGNPYYTDDGETQLGLRQIADAQRAADGNLVSKIANSTPRCTTCGYIGCREHRAA